ncbi:hypothetical protein ARMGADRAFT_638060 [Armillaria gallica]|uniref:Uncharacterized protein n=1 Tax=Armillaria gallica TaxID=47427 RepID=A0A2H3E9Z4_ARMGA|nr:hypothetical protein ARMGADRAFT_638060 [Armillaria gallica]
MKEVYVRSMSPYGALHITPPFRKVIFVATGEWKGRSQCFGWLPTLRQLLATRCVACFREELRVLLFTVRWRVFSLLACSNLISLSDTRKHGKPDTIKITKRFVDEFKPKCVCVISSQRLIEKVIYGLRSRGTLAFGSILRS